MTAIRGAGGGGSKTARSPIESPDSLHSIAYARILDLVSEGEIVGFADQARPLTCVFFNETPVANDDGTLNFKNVQIDWRTGTQSQDYIKGFQSAENEIGVSVELKQSTPWTRAISNTNLSAVRVRLSTPALSKADTATGDISGYSVSYAIDLQTAGGAFTTVLSSSLTGKTTTKYERSHRIDLPASTSGWVIRVRRITPPAASGAIQDLTYVESYAEIVDAKLRYPMSALVSTVVDAEQFNNIPTRAFDLKGRIIRVPSNYDPTTRAYAGIWDGTFKPAWTDNPAWVFYDLATHERYGLGHIVPPSLIDKWALYTIARYCDQFVPDGRGGQEPRFTANLYLQTQADAYKAMQDLGTMFCGIMYAAGGSITAVADMPADPVYVYTQANVIEGKFSYAGSGRRARHTVALVSWNDMTDFGRAKVQYVEDEEGIARYGVQPTEVIAIGCTSQGQAQRMGRYILTTGRLETDVVTFAVGLDGTVAAPGQIVLIADKLRAGRRTGGRIRIATSSVITVDSPPQVSAGDKITVVLPNAIAEQRTVTAVSGNNISVSPSFSQLPAPHAAWIVQSADLAAQRFRVLSVHEKDNGIGYEIVALKHVEGKFAFVEQGTRIDEPPIAQKPGKTQLPPTGLTISHREFAGAVVATTIVTMSWVAPAGAVSYDVEWRLASGSWVKLPKVSETTAEASGITPGTFDFKVTATNAAGVKSAPAFESGYVVPDQTNPPDIIDTLNINLDDISDKLAKEVLDRFTGDVDEANKRAQDLADEAAARAAALAAERAAREVAIAATKKRIDDIISDDIISADEKPKLIIDYEAVINERPGILQQAGFNEVTTEATAYDTAVNNLVAYMATLTAPVKWSDTSGITYII